MWIYVELSIVCYQGQLEVGEEMDVGYSVEELEREFSSKLLGRQQGRCKGRRWRR